MHTLRHVVYFRKTSSYVQDAERMPQWAGTLLLAQTKRAGPLRKRTFIPADDVWQQNLHLEYVRLKGGENKVICPLYAFCPNPSDDEDWKVFRIRVGTTVASTPCHQPPPWHPWQLNRLPRAILRRISELTGRYAESYQRILRYRTKMEPAQMAQLQPWEQALAAVYLVPPDLLSLVSLRLQLSRIMGGESYTQSVFHAVVRHSPKFLDQLRATWPPVMDARQKPNCAALSDPSDPSAPRYDLSTQTRSLLTALSNQLVYASRTSEQARLGLPGVIRYRPFLNDGTSEPVV